MAAGVFGSPDVKIDRQPLFGFSFIENFFPVFRVTVAQVIPGGTDESIHGVDIPFCRSVTFRTLSFDEFRYVGQRGTPFRDKIFDVFR